MNLTEIKFSHDPLGLSGSYNQPSQASQEEFYSNNVYQKSVTPKKESNGLKYFLWSLGILLFVVGVIIWVNSSKEEIDTTLYISDEKNWDLAYLEAKKQENKAKFKKDVGWVIYK